MNMLRYIPQMYVFRPFQKHLVLVYLMYRGVVFLKYFKEVHVLFQQIAPSATLEIYHAISM